METTQLEMQSIQDLPKKPKKSAKEVWGIVGTVIKWVLIGLCALLLISNVVCMIKMKNGNPVPTFLGVGSAKVVTRSMEPTIMVGDVVVIAHKSSYKVGDVIKLKANATYYNGVSIPNFVKKSTLYYRGTNKNGIIISTQKTGAITGVVKADALESGISTPAQPTQPTTSSIYTVKVTANCLNIRRGPGTNYGISSQIRDKGIYTIVETRGNWGRLKSGRGWICLDYTKKC